jgi:hypothetical protein
MSAISSQCENDSCTEFQIEKVGDLPEYVWPEVICGTCGQPLHITPVAPEPVKQQSSRTKKPAAGPE